MVDIDRFLDDFVERLKIYFGERIWFVGLQGSYARNEATDKSDIDLVVILDELTSLDIETYNKLLDSLPNRELMCGFLSGEKELLNWDPSDLFQFYFDTKPIIGEISCLLNIINEETIKTAVRTSVCNIYHACVHNMLYEKNEDILRSLYKSASFTLQAIVYLKEEKYICQLNELIKVLEGEDKKIIEVFLKLKRSPSIEFITLSELMFNWVKDKVNEIA